MTMMWWKHDNAVGVDATLPIDNNKDDERGSVRRRN
jgi:hypothetical protein